jgi:hypothetical protein
MNNTKIKEKVLQEIEELRERANELEKSKDLIRVPELKESVYYQLNRKEAELKGIKEAQADELRFLEKLKRRHLDINLDKFNEKEYPAINKIANWTNQSNKLILKRIKQLEK